MPGRSEAGVGTARLSEGPLVGRVELMEELVAAANAAVRGSGSIVVLTGEAGIGKTTSEVLARMRSNGSIYADATIRTHPRAHMIDLVFEATGETTPGLQEVSCLLGAIGELVQRVSDPVRATT